MQQVVCFGEILWDNFPSGKMAGGAPMNVALHLHKQGTGSRLISSVGNDQNGKDLIAFLAEHGLSTEFIQQHSTLPTGIVEVKLDENGQATYTIVKPVAWDEIVYHENLTSLIKTADALVFGSLACRSEISYHTLMKLIETSKVSIFDMNLRPPHFNMSILENLMNKSTILKVNEHELEYLTTHLSLATEDIEKQLSKLSSITQTSTICVTLGDKGACIFHEGEFYTHPGFSIKVADTVGAGDSFLAAFINGYLQNTPMQQTLSRACAAGALVASRHGANPPYTIDEIAEFINF
ncbi:carbohydrate kinase [Pedobacter sp. P351]|uniref:carbohydrate kinase family protein n=1 Tax=Pedobacter superstes TaxID=3133441 RepID=UPI0030AA677D